MSDKINFKGTFNYMGQNIIKFKHAISIDHAFFLMTREIAKDLNVHHSVIRYYFGGMKDNFKIMEA